MYDVLLWVQTHGETFWLIVLTTNAVLTAFVILLENREPERSIAWLLALLVFPLVGFIFYLFFGRDWHKRSYQEKRLIHALTLQRRQELAQTTSPVTGLVDRMRAFAMNVT